MTPMPERNFLASLDAIAMRGMGKKVKQTLFVRKITVDLDAGHLRILEKRLKTIGAHGTQRAIFWEALELLAGKYGIQWQKGIDQ